MTTISDPMLATAKRNLRHFVSKTAAFKCEADREAAINCLDVIEAAEARAREEGAKAMQEAAGLECKARSESEARRLPSSSTYRKGMEWAGDRIADAIAALDPAQIAGGGK